jgi:DHA2 family lincomycin resistance protein-like MFS transporter
MQAIEADAATDFDPTAIPAAQRKLVVSLLLVSTFVVVLNETALAVALPVLMRDLHTTAVAAQWLTTIFLLTMAVVIPVTGFLLQRLNTRPVFLLAMSSFSIGTLICALAPRLTMLIIGRAVQAIGTAIMMPLLTTTAMTLVPVSARGRFMGNVIVVLSVAPAIGPTISGVILSLLSWRWLFIFVLPIAIASMTIGGFRIPNVSHPRNVKLDIASVPLCALAFGGGIYGLSQLGVTEPSPTGISTWTLIEISGAAFVIFVFRQLRLQRADNALLDLRVLASATFSISMTIVVILMMAMFGVLILLPIFLQNVLALPTWQAGLVLLPGSLIMGFASKLVGGLYDRHGLRVLALPGALVFASTLWVLSWLSTSTPVLTIILCHVALSVGLAMMFTPLFTAGLGSLPSHLYSHGSAMLGTAQQVGGAAGAALFVSLLSVTSASGIHRGMDAAAATAAGIGTAFHWAAILSALPIILSVVNHKHASVGSTPQHQRA